MHWIPGLLEDTRSVAYNVLILSLAIAAGLALGKVSFKGIRLGISGVLFSGLLLGHLGFGLDPTILDFVREFGLIIFVYAVGLTVGPGFFNALKAQGLTLNLLASGVVFLGVVTTVFGSRLLQIPAPVATGVFSGAVTNTPALAAAGQVLRDQPPRKELALKALSLAATGSNFDTGGGRERQDGLEVMSELRKLPDLGCAVTYPFGVIGVILAMLIMQWSFGIDLRNEAAKEAEAAKSRKRILAKRGLKVTNPNLEGCELGKLPALEHLNVAISRIQRAEKVYLAESEFRLSIGDVLVAVGESGPIDELKAIVGEEVAYDPSELPSELSAKWLTVTKSGLVGKTVDELKWESRFIVQVTRLRRAGVEFPPHTDVKISLGDELLVVGREDSLKAVAKDIGDDPKKLAEPDLIPIFVGIALGVLLGSRPFYLPGIPWAVRLGLAGGPLLVAIVLSRIQRIGSLVWDLPTPANLLLKEMGICLFLAAVGIKSGDRFVATLVTGNGLSWLALGAAVTLLPVFVISIVGFHFCKVPYVKLTGVLAGSMTSPPALAFAIGRARSESPTVAYATVFPLTMILRVISAQLMMAFWVSG